MKIILDAMGGDHAPEAPVLGAIEAAKAYGVEITLVGRGEAILEVMKKHSIETLPRVWRSPMRTMWWICTMIPVRLSTDARIPP